MDGEQLQFDFMRCPMCNGSMSKHGECLRCGYGGEDPNDPPFDDPDDDPLEYEGDEDDDDTDEYPYNEADFEY